MDFAVPANHGVKLKDNEKKDKRPDLAVGLKKKQWEMKVKVIPIVIVDLDTVIKGLVKGREELEKRGWLGTIQTTALLRSARILRRVLDTWEGFLSLKLQWKTIS